LGEVGWVLLGRTRHLPTGLDLFPSQWAETCEFSKFLGSPFGLLVSSSNIDQFLIDRTDKKLQYWITQHLNTTVRPVIANGVLISSTLYFLALWGCIQHGVKKIIAQACNFVWIGSDKQGCARVAWKTCCLTKKDGKLGLIDPTDAIITPMGKWLVSACEPGKNNLRSCFGIISCTSSHILEATGLPISGGLPSPPTPPIWALKCGIKLYVPRKSSTKTTPRGTSELQRMTELELFGGLIRQLRLDPPFQRQEELL
jgi:hypothetical protein